MIWIVAISLRWKVFFLLWFIVIFIITFIHVHMRRYLWYPIDDHWWVIPILPPAPIAHIMMAVRCIGLLYFNVRMLSIHIIVYFRVRLVHLEYIVIIICGWNGLFVMVSIVMIIIVVVSLVTVTWVLTETFLAEHVAVPTREVLLLFKDFMVSKSQLCIHLKNIGLAS